jgi:APA family basic amino acid/polyamine antiporter
MMLCGGVIVLRHKNPEMDRPFKVPLSPWIPLLGILCCLYLVMHLPLITWLRFIVWMTAGLIIYFIYSRYHSELHKSENGK